MTSGVKSSRTDVPILVYLRPLQPSGQTFPRDLHARRPEPSSISSTAFQVKWQVDETLGGIEQRRPEAIVVGIPHAGEYRMAEYSPFVDGERGQGRGEAYRLFVVKAVKPLVERNFRTLDGKSHTGIMGSSMGRADQSLCVFPLSRHLRNLPVR